VFYDVGTTVVEVVRALPSDLVGQAVTNSGHAADELATRPGLRVQNLDGAIRGEDERAASGPTVESAFAASYADVAFLSSGGVHPFSGVTDYFPDEIRVKTLMLNRSLVRYVLAESAKLGRVAAHRVCDLNAVTAVITDWKVSRDMLDAFTRRGVRVHQAPPVDVVG
jgi:DeoR family glycerol-3-phosphate regulon repressor